MLGSPSYLGCGIRLTFWAHSSKEFVDISLFLLNSDWRTVVKFVYVSVYLLF